MERIIAGKKTCVKRFKSLNSERIFRYFKQLEKFFPMLPILL